jgi:hypothetical protein
MADLPKKVFLRSIDAGYGGGEWDETGGIGFDAPYIPSTSLEDAERENAELHRRIVRHHVVCTKENCILDGGNEHAEYFVTLQEAAQ